MDQPHLPESQGAAPLRSVPPLCKSQRSQPQKGLTAALLGCGTSVLPAIDAFLHSTYELS